MCKLNVSEIRKFILVVLLIGILMIPIQYIILAIATLSIQPVYAIIHREVFGVYSFPWGTTVDVRRIVEFLFAAFGIHIIYTFVYSLIFIPFRKKAEFYMLGILVVTVLFSILTIDMRTPRATGFPIRLDLEYYFAYSFLFATIMFANFVLFIYFHERKTEWKKWKKLLSSFILSTFFGSFFSYYVWIMLFGIFHSS